MQKYVVALPLFLILSACGGSSSDSKEADTSAPPPTLVSKKNNKYEFVIQMTGGTNVKANTPQNGDYAHFRYWDDEITSYKMDISEFLEDEEDVVKMEDGEFYHKYPSAVGTKEVQVALCKPFDSTPGHGFVCISSLLNDNISPIALSVEGFKQIEVEINLSELVVYGDSAGYYGSNTTGQLKLYPPDYFTSTEHTEQSEGGETYTTYLCIDVNSLEITPVAETSVEFVPQARILCE